MLKKNVLETIIFFTFYTRSTNSPNLKLLKYLKKNQFFHFPLIPYMSRF